MSDSSLQNKAISSLLLKFIEKCFSLGVQLVISIILARILSPNDYGIIAIINVFIVLSVVFIDSGFGVGLIQKKDLESIDINTMFTMSLLMSIALYALIFLFAPVLAIIYEMPIITSVLRVYGITIIISSICSVQNSILSRWLEYKKQLIATIIATFISGAIGIWMAYVGYGVWALVFEQLIQKIVYMAILFFIIKFKFKIAFNKSSFQNIFRFSWKLVASKLILTLSGQTRNLVIGKKYSSEVLGYYNKGQQIPSTVASATDYSLQGVLFSVYSRAQDNPVRLKSMVRRSMKLSSYILFPMMIGIAAVSPSLVRVLLTEKWLFSVPFMRIACFIYMIQLINTANIQAINATGNSKIYLKVELIKCIVDLGLLVVCILFFDVYVLAISSIAVTLIGWLFYVFYSKKILNYCLKEQLRDILPALLLSLLMGACVLLMAMFEIHSILSLFLQILVGIIVYIVGSKILGLESFECILSILKKTFKAKNNYKE